MCQQVDCGCEHPGHHTAPEMGPHRWGCCHPGSGLRRFPNRGEVIAQLQEYLADLRAEASGVEGRLAELKKE